MENPHLIPKVEFEEDPVYFPTDANTFQCDQCDYVATVLIQLKYHKERTHGKSKYICYKCTFVAATSKQLEEHKKNNHKEGVVKPKDIIVPPVQVQHTPINISVQVGTKKGKIPKQYTLPCPYRN